MNTSLRRAKAVYCVAVGVVVSGCEVGPNYQPPQVKVNAQYSEITPPAAGTTQPSQVTAMAPPPGQWWTVFNDPELDRLIERAVKGNLDLQQAQSRVRQARYQEMIAGADFYPTVNVDGGYNHARGSKNVIIPPGAFGSSFSSGSAPASAAPQGRIMPLDQTAGGNLNSQGGSTGGAIAGPESPLGQGGLPGVTTDVYQVGFDASWEIDVFGGTRRGVEAASADTAAAIEDQRSVMVSLLAEVARNYVELRGYQRQLVIAQQNLAIQQDTLELTKSKYQSGFVTDLDVVRQEDQVARTTAQIAPLEAQIDQSIHDLGILLGQDPNSLMAELSKNQPIPPVPGLVPVGIPSELLRRRPDIRRAERQIAAATARIGVATADLFPKFTITGLLGLDSTKPKNLFNYSSYYYSLVPGVSWPIFDAGRIQNNIHVQNELERQAVLAYEQTVLEALKEVEDSLATYRTEQARRLALIDSVTASRQALHLAREQYQQGVIDFLTVLDTERSLLDAENALAQSDLSVSDDLVSLYKALGGGWEMGGKS